MLVTLCSGRQPPARALEMGVKPVSSLKEFIIWDEGHTKMDVCWIGLRGQFPWNGHNDCSVGVNVPCSGNGEHFHVHRHCVLTGV